MSLALTSDDINPQVCFVCQKQVPYKDSFSQHSQSFCSLKCCKEYHKKWLIEHPPEDPKDPPRFLNASYGRGGPGFA